MKMALGSSNKVVHGVILERQLAAAGGGLQSALVHSSQLWTVVASKLGFLLCTAAYSSLKSCT